MLLGEPRAVALRAGLVKTSSADSRNHSAPDTGARQPKSQTLLRQNLAPNKVTRAVRAPWRAE